MTLRSQPISSLVLLDRYAVQGETTPLHIYTRVGQALATIEAPARRKAIFQRFLQNMRWGAIGAGRIMVNAGTERASTMINCFVQPVGLNDRQLSFEAGLAQARTTLAMGGGVGYDFSVLPPASSENGKRLPSVCSAIDRYDRMCEQQQYEGSRRGAQMAVLTCTHPDLLQFIEAKSGRMRWKTFNISVAVSDAFMHAVLLDSVWPLSHAAKPHSAIIARGAHQQADGSWVYKVMPARTLWSRITEAARLSSEPGMLYIDTIQRTNNLRAIESIAATNPCGEQPLPPCGSCVLGPINLTRLVINPFGLTSPPSINWRRLATMARTQVRLLDNVIDLTNWPVLNQKAEALSKRRIGLGVTGLSDMLTLLQLRYDTNAGRRTACDVIRFIRDQAYFASAALAAERGTFPLYREQDYLEPGTVGASLPRVVREAIRRYGLRNSHLLSIAPTGSVSLAFADNCSNGVEPAYDWSYTRTLRLQGQPATPITVENHAWRLWRHLHGQETQLPDYFVNATSMSPQDHIAMLAAMQPYVDASISKTVPIAPNCSQEDVQTLFMQAWRGGLKGLTVFRPDPHMDAVMRMASRSPAEPSCRTCA